MIAPDRPGYGASTWKRRRTLEGWANDVAELADHLDIERFAVMGVSGGGPHAAACGRLRNAAAANALPFWLMSVRARRAPERLVKGMPAADAAVLARPEVRSSFLAFAHASPTTGRAAAQEFGLFARDWGFELGDVAMPGVGHLVFVEHLEEILRELLASRTYRPAN